MNIELKKSDERDFGRDERIIMVDGVRWGRTIVTHHGWYGTKYTFSQENGGTIYDDPNARYPHEINVRSERKRRAEPGTWRPTEERVLEKIGELIASGKLRDPAIVKKESDEARKAYNARQAERTAAEEAAFRAKADQAIRGMTGYVLTGLGEKKMPHTEDIEAVVAVMRWAQEQ